MMWTESICALSFISLSRIWTSCCIDRWLDSSSDHTGSSFSYLRCTCPHALVLSRVAQGENHPISIGLIFLTLPPDARSLACQRKQRDPCQQLLSLLILVWRLIGKMLCVYTLLEGGNSLLQCRCLDTLTDNLHVLLKHLPRTSGNTNLELEQWLCGNLKHCIFNVSLGTLLRWASRPTPMLPPGAVAKASSCSSQPCQPHSDSHCSHNGQWAALHPAGAICQGPTSGRRQKSGTVILTDLK